MDRHDRILQLVRMKGPLLPSQINREVKTDVLFASAMLSELVDRKVLKLSHAKIGGSPVYFMPGQESRLGVLYDYLHEKEKRAYDMLKQSKILRDSEQEPVIRAALREIKDFAVPLEVTLNNTNEIFWKWSIMSDSDAERMIRTFLKVPEDKPQQEVQPAHAPEPAPQPVQAPKPTPEPVRQEVQPEPKQVNKPEPQAEPESVPEPIPEPATVKGDVVDEKIEEMIIKEPSKVDVPKKKKKKELQTALEEPVPQVMIFPEGDTLFDQVYEFFNRNHIEISDVSVIRKNSEIDFLIDLPSNIGSLQYFCKAKSKKKISDGDLSSAFIQGQIKKMPILFLTLGDMTKKAKDMLDTEFKTMFVRKIE